MGIRKERTRLSSGQLAKRILLLIFSLLFSCLLAEGVARLLYPHWAPRTARITNLWQYDSRYGWSHIPGVTGDFRSYAIDTVVTINSKGFRGREVSYARVGGSRRVLVLGDSLVWGFGVESDETFTTQMEKLIPHVEVVNLGVSGYGTDQELLLYQDEGRKYRADVVMVVVAPNDRGSNTRTVEYLIYGKPAFVLRGGNLELINQPVAKTAWVKRSAVKLAWRSYILSQLERYMYAGGVTHASVAEGDPEHKDVAGSVPNGAAQKLPQSFAAWEITLRLLLEFKRVTSQNGAELVVVFADGLGTVFAREMAVYLAGLNIDSMFLDEYIDRHDKSLYLPDMLHWNPAGHKIIAAALAEKLRRK